MLGGSQSQCGRGDEKLIALPGLELGPLCPPASSQSLYRLPYPTSECKVYIKNGSGKNVGGPEITNREEHGKETPWPESASELYRESRLSGKLVQIFADRECHVVSVTDPYDRILGFLDRSSYFFFQVAPQRYS
jgi:hypothetical protein